MGLLQSLEMLRSMGLLQSLEMLRTWEKSFQALAVWLGVFPGPVSEYAARIATAVF